MRSISALVILFACVVARAQDATGVYAGVGKLLDAERAKSKIPGYAAAVYYKGEIQWAKAAGFSDLAQKRLVRRDTPFRLASISKPITAVALLQLLEMRKLSLTDDARKYCPAFPAKPYPIQIGQLLGHLGGIRHYNGVEDMNNMTIYRNVGESLRKFAADPLLHEPGTKYHYTTYGYSVLGCAIEGASGMSYEKWLEDRVLATVGMCSTAPDTGRGISARRALGYRKTEAGEVEDCDVSDNTAKIPGGGLVSTVDDLLRFVDGIYRQQLLRYETIEQMWTSGRTKAGKLTGYGLGWSLARSPEGEREVYHTGGQQGTSTILYLRPDQRFAFVWLTNLEAVENRLPVSRAIYKAVAGK
jgi:CubicO group peptidase (beta-lactamase class C family)